MALTRVQSSVKDVESVLCADTVQTGAIAVSKYNMKYRYLILSCVFDRRENTIKY